MIPLLAFTFTPEVIAICVLAPVAVAGMVGLFFRADDKGEEVRGRAYDVGTVAASEGFSILADIMKYVAIGDATGIVKEAKILYRMFMKPGALMAHLDELFTKQLVKRLADPAKSLEVFAAVDKARAVEAQAKAKLVDEVKADLAKAGQAAGKAADVAKDLTAAA